MFIWIESDRVGLIFKPFTGLYRVRHIKCYREIALELLIISKNVSDKSSSVREGRHTGPPYFFIGGETKAKSERENERFLRIF